MNLSQLKPGETAVIEGIFPKDSTVLKILSLGLIEGTTVTCLTQLYTCMEIEFHGSHMAISKETASRYSCKKLGD